MKRPRDKKEPLETSKFPQEAPPVQAPTLARMVSGAHNRAAQAFLSQPLRMKGGHTHRFHLRNG